MSDVAPDDLVLAASVVAEALAPFALDEAAWLVSPGDLEWTCRRTLDHTIDAVCFYTGQLAARAEGRRPFLRNGDAGAAVADLLVTLETAAAVLASVATAAGPRVRAFHPAGRADTSGFLAMACDEVLVHGWDVATGLGAAAGSFRPPEGLARMVLGRLFPWVAARAGEDPWEVLLWANGRVGLPGGRAQLGRDWYWHAAPLSEWDGQPKRRTSPPGWV